MTEASLSGPLADREVETDFRLVDPVLRTVPKKDPVEPLAGGEPRGDRGRNEHTST